MIHVNEHGDVSVVAGAWWFAAISIPLTVTTFLVWKIWLSHSLKVREKKMKKIATGGNQVEDDRPALPGKIKMSASITSRLMHALRDREKRERFGVENIA